MPEKNVEQEKYFTIPLEVTREYIISMIPPSDDYEKVKSFIEKSKPSIIQNLLEMASLDIFEEKDGEFWTNVHDSIRQGLGLEKIKNPFESTV